MANHGGRCVPRRTAGWSRLCTTTWPCRQSQPCTTCGGRPRRRPRPCPGPPPGMGRDSEGQSACQPHTFTKHTVTAHSPHSPQRRAPCQAQPHHIQRTDLERAVAVIRVVDPGDRQHYVGPDLDPVFRCCNVTCNLTARPRVMTDAPQKGGKKKERKKGARERNRGES